MNPGSIHRTRLLFCAALVAVLIFSIACSAPASGERAIKVTEVKTFPGPLAGGGVMDRQLLGLCSHDFETGLKAKAPASEWQYVRNVRLNITWGSIQRNSRNSYDWSSADAQVNSALSLGINSVLITLGGPIPLWAADPARGEWNRYAPPRDMQDWYNFCHEAAKRYKGYVDYYQIWQEPGWDIDCGGTYGKVVYFGGRCDYDYMGMLRSGYEGIKAADPEAFVFSGSMLNGITRQQSDFVNYEVLLAGGNQDISMKVEADKDVVAERPMYFNYHGVWPGGHDQAGVGEPGTTWYLAEGATHPGFEEWICIQNPGDSSANISITYMFPGGDTQEQAVSVKGHARATVDVNTAVGPYKDVSARVVSDQPVVVERPMYFNYHNAWPGGSIGAGVSEPSDTWYLAEGATHEGFEQWISLMNPNGNWAKVDLTYMFPGGETQEQTLSMPPTSRETILVNGVVGSNRDVSTMIESTLPILAERPMYFNYHNAWPGGHTQVGATEAAKSWFLSEGTTRNNPHDGSFEEWISIQNPSDQKARVDLTYMFPGGGTQKQALEVPSRGRETVMVNNVVGSDKDVSVQIDSDQEIICERPMYFNYHNSYSGGHVEIGARDARDTWYFAEGTTRSGFEEWLTLQNPNTSDANATITFMFGDSTTQTKTVNLPPESRTTIGVNESVSIATICDGIALHPYDYPEHWAQYYNTLKGICANEGCGGLEIVVTEIGWPHGGREGFSMEGQRKAIGDEGVGSLWGAGCKKIWIYEDVDDAPGTSWDDADAGLFDYWGNATPAWGEYKRWQSLLVNYGNLPTHLPW